jgi:hypothetical protein
MLFVAAMLAASRLLYVVRGSLYSVHHDGAQNVVSRERLGVELKNAALELSHSGVRK